jgi:hypothetical protein
MSLRPYAFDKTIPSGRRASHCATSGSDPDEEKADPKAELLVMREHAKPSSTPATRTAAVRFRKLAATGAVISKQCQCERHSGLAFSDKGPTGRVGPRFSRPHRMSACISHLYGADSTNLGRQRLTDDALRDGLLPRPQCC